MIAQRVVDPLAWIGWLWPHIILAKYQKEILYSIRDNDVTVVTAGNELGKDFIAGLVVLWYFESRHPCRICTSSTTDEHLDVLWGEIGRFIDEAAHPLEYKKGGNLIVGHRRIKKVVHGEICPLSKIKGVVPAPNKTAGLQGFHIDSTDGVPRNLWVCDEASGAVDEMYTMAMGWAKRAFVFGNPWPCNNFFYKAVEGDLETGIAGGDITKDDPRESGLYRKVLHVAAENSPNVQLGLMEERAGEVPSHRNLIPGLKTYATYKKHCKLLTTMEKCVMLDGRFYKGPQEWLFPAEWLDLAMARADEIAVEQASGQSFKSERIARIMKRAFSAMPGQGIAMRGKRTLGVDTAEGGDWTIWTPASSGGIFTQLREKTPDTSVIFGKTLAYQRDYGVAPENTLFDRGGGGKEHADYLRRAGYNVRTVGFGESVSPDKKRGLTPLEKRKLEDEERYVYKNRRAQMYGMLSEVLNPANGFDFALSRTCTELVNQLRVIPKLYDGEGRLWLPPKRKKDPNSKEKTMKDLIGRSPDEADSAVLAIYGLFHKVPIRTAGVLQ